MSINNDRNNRQNFFFSNSIAWLLRLKTTTLVQLCWGITLLSVFGIVCVPQGGDSDFWIFLLLEVGLVFFGIGGVIMILRKQTIFSGYSDNPVAIIYGAIIAILGFGLFILLIALMLTNS